MKVLFDETMELITPCFCAGADQEKAEIRAPAIRGELRWWLRALGGTQEEEQSIFGGIAGDEGSSSAIVVRISMLPRQKEESRELPGNQRFFTMSRKSDEAMIPAGRRFRLQILLRRTVESQLINRAIETMTLFGAIGLRSNRGCGAMQSSSHPSKAEVDSLMDELKNSGFSCFRLEPERDAYAALCVLEEKLKIFREDCGIKENSRNALGFVDGNKRHGSCLRVRPVALKDGKFIPVLLYSESAMGEGIESIQSKLCGWFA